MKCFESLLLALFALFGLCCALGATEPAFLLQKDYLGAIGYPRIIGFLLAASCLGALLRLWHTRKPASSEGNAFPQLRHAVAPIALAVAYVAGIAWFGFIISTFIYLCIMPCFLGGGTERAVLLKNLLYAGIVTGVIEAFFKVFKIYLPTTYLF
ncbi:MAG: tripartite tricarboxylate transporter TctB family protein [Desulfovibrio sp.]|uniref:tripartite tricarboxylate transporter TctB family protein n=1 Tax=Desulfovibrio sp. TaxID=885 RepID=UPI0025BDAAC1|nr:tripartite tricarboxylate transporter TctB family protein [Desulfovibrio sp.]MBS6830379.1 tripartite tricarboxylate transporter TctB family protein [Desulfovibrio sp.]